jgi:hypothetical protein
VSRNLRILGAVSACLAIVVPSALAAVIDRVQVGVPGNAATRGFSPALAVTLTVPPGLARACCYDGVSGAWAGPRYEATGNPSRGDTSRVVWYVDFDRGKSSMRTLARRAAWRDGDELQARNVSVPHVVASHRVGSLSGFELIEAEPAPSARQLAVVVVSLGRGLRAVITFDLSSPFSDSAGTEGDFVIAGMRPSQWNLIQAKAAVRRVGIEGTLPPARVGIRASGRLLAGKVTDQFGHPTSESPVKLQQRTGGSWQVVGKGTTLTTGRYALTATGRGQFRVVATLAGSSARSRVVRIA